MTSEQKMSRMALTAMVVGGMVGAGIFSLPRTFANATGPMGAVIAWIIAGTGMYMLARVFQALAEETLLSWRETIRDGADDKAIRALHARPHARAEDSRKAAEYAAP